MALESAEALLLLSNNMLLLGPLVVSLGAMVLRASLCSQVVLLHCDADNMTRVSLHAPSTAPRSMATDADASGLLFVVAVSSNLLVLGPLVVSLGMMVLRASMCSQVVLLQYDADNIV
ncbi:hypothetical protein SDRG_09672 [Saprolegnia diclina VS20]|uniref:Uncharacterized protein n=1 Tax=Saprolegnia diclina (strain VS20) TaxID=1156394 RepID=T0RK75_SAPDV|nr:hypothetical protein SDRG_09672 [Saprolegnia diclina VS20]EQC32698.1 hypothetical protein SDRG_09672 [Saprolegnia diclina VS20]|eukprot:XP_008613842.1 hypothetical protein SDRG_09672 [Saprolegnia diclina VS20]